MPTRYSPPLKPTHLTENSPRARSLLRNRTRYLYILPLLLLLYVYHRSTIHLLPSKPPSHDSSLVYQNVEWTRYAYSLYATNSAYLCNAVMVFEALSRLGSKADRVLFYREEWDLEVESSTDRDSQLLVKARDDYGVKLMPAEILAGDGGFTKFMAWGLSQYERVLQMDTDVTVLKNMDGLFLAPRAPVAMWRAYWKLPKVKELTSSFALLEPSELDHQQLMVSQRPDVRRKDEDDTEVLNRFYGDSAMVLSHREFGLLTSEFRTDDHTSYLGSVQEPWDPERVMNHVSLVHFSDYPLPKPWVMWPHKLVGEIMPKCKLGELGDDDCRNKKVWMELYDDFRKRRKDVCALLSAPAPEWPPPNSTKEID